MLYQKLRRKLYLLETPLMDLTELKIVKKSLAILDPQCMRLDYKDIEKLWKNFIEVNNIKTNKITKAKIIIFLTNISETNIKSLLTELDNIPGIDNLEED